MIFLPTFWQRWGTTAKGVLDTAVTKIGYSSKKYRLKSNFIDRVIATFHCHFTSFSSFLNDFLRFFRFPRFFFLCLRLCFVALLLLTQLLTDGVQSYQVWLWNCRQIYVQVIYFKKLEAIRLSFLIYICFVVKKFLTT